MKKETLMGSLAIATLLVSLAACSSVAQEAQHDHQYGAAASPEGKPAPATGQSAANPHPLVSPATTMDMKMMCDMHRKMMTASSPADRKAMMDKEMHGMSAEQKREHIKMMDKQCQ